MYMYIYICIYIYIYIYTLYMRIVDIHVYCLSYAHLGKE